METVITNVHIRAGNRRVLRVPYAQSIFLGRRSYDLRGSLKKEWAVEDEVCILEVSSNEGFFVVPLKDVERIEFEIHSEKKKTYASISSSTIPEEENNE